MEHLSHRRGFAALALFATLLSSFAFAEPAHAESGRWNLHFSGLGPLPTAGEASVDWQLAQPFAIEARAGGGVVSPFGQTVDGLFYFTVGARFRFFDDESGYLDEGGSIAGHLWLAPHVGVFLGGSGPDAGLLLDMSIGYDFSIVSPVSIGPFLRGGVGVASNVAAFVAGGLEVSVEIDPIRTPRAPRVDTDQDRVYDDTDACPGTPLGSDVDTRGCIVLPPALVLDGIEFEFARADILPSSEDTLDRAARLLADNPDARVEIGGHTDDLGTDAINEELSLARATSVRDWLIRNGVHRSRLEVRGYGASRPRAPNTDEASRAMNRRIEFRQLD